MKSRQIHTTGAALWAKLPEGDLPDTVTVQGVVFTVEQVDKIANVFRRDVPLIVQRLRQGRLAVTNSNMPAGVWAVFEPDGKWDQPAVRSALT